MTVFARSILFLSAYLPAFVLLGVRAAASNGWLAFAFAVLCVLAIVGLAVLYAALRRVKQRHVTVRSAEGRSQEVAEFLFAYVLPFVISDYRDSFTVAALALFFLLLWIVYVRGHLVHLNPVLLALGWAVWYAEVVGDQQQEPEQVVLITDVTDLREGASLWIYPTDSAIQFATKERKRV